uniref:Uncharacterized protein n=1 Tax=Rhizophagus irregularis (strain DAOM 181602 / DAOM 197198 / MUCL 43194) TaxID=747089 RepID=U9U0L6_RHIID
MNLNKETNLTEKSKGMEFNTYVTKANSTILLYGEIIGQEKIPESSVKSFSICTQAQTKYKVARLTVYIVPEIRYSCNRIAQQEDLKKTSGLPYSGTILPPRITNQGPSVMENRTLYLITYTFGQERLGCLKPNRRPNYHKDIASKTLPSIGPSSP